MSLLRPSLIKAGLRDLVRRPVQTALMVLGVALGVAVVLAIDLANASARRGFELSTEAVIGRATHRIEGGPTGLDEQLYFDLRAAGFRASAPVIEGWVVASEFDNQPLRILGLDPLAEALFRNLFPGDTSARPGFERFYTHSDQVIIGEGLAQRLSLTPGDSLKISTERRLSLTVLGVVSASSEADRRLFSDLLLMDLAAAQEVLDQVGRLTRIDLILTPGELSRLEDRLPPGVVLSTASEQAETAAQLTSAFQLNLTALSLLALVVGMFLIYNTVTFSVVQRREVFGTLRALGVTADELIVQITTEAIVVAGLGALIGVGLGWLMGQSAVRLVTQTINDLYFVSSVREAQLGPWSVLKAVALGVGAGALAALGPAWEAARVPPITALQRSSLEIRTRALAPRLALIGLGLIAIGSLALLLIQRLLALNLAAILVLLVGLALMVPLATIVAMRIVGPLLEAVFGVIGRMAARTVITALSRTSIAIAALMVALSVTIGVGLMIASFRNTVENWLDLTVRADVYVAPLTNSSVQSRLTFSPTWAERLKDIPGVVTVETYRNPTVESEFGELQLIVVETDRQREAELYRLASGDPSQVWELVRQGAIMISEPLAYRLDLFARDAQLGMITDQGLRRFPIVAVYYDYTSDRGTVMISRETFLRYWDDPGLSSIGLFLAPDASLGQVGADVSEALQGAGLRIQPNRDLRQQALEVFDRTFAITVALRLLAVAVAFIGVWSALMALQLERRKELATLMALGLDRRGLSVLTILESALMGLIAGILALPVGAMLALILVYIINLRSFGWSIQLVSVPELFIQALLVGILAALAAAILPLRSQLRQPIAEGLRAE